MDKSKEKKWFIGIDISNETLDVSIVNEQYPNQFKDKKVSNDIAGFESILKWFKSLKVNPKDCMFCMEHTGTYGLLLFGWLESKGITFSVISGLEIKKSLGLTRGKNDKVDARRIANYAREKNRTLPIYHLPGKNIVQIKQLLTFRDQLVRYQTGFKNSKNHHKQYGIVTKNEAIVEDIELLIKDLKKRILALEKEIIAIIKSDEDLKKNFDNASSVKGVGLITTAFMIVTTNNFKAFDNGRSYCCYTGTAPFGVSSGISKGKEKTSHFANKRVRSLLSNGANSAITNDPEIREFYLRKSKEGKDAKVIANAVSCKLINRVFATVKRGTPYVAIYSQNFLQKNLVVS